MNDGIGGSGTDLQGFDLNFEVLDGRAHLRIDGSGTPGNPDDDPIDLANAAGPSPALTTAGNGFSYVRVGAAAQTLQVAVYPATTAPFRGGIEMFEAVEVVRAGRVLSDVSVNGGLGFQFAVLSLDTTATGLHLFGQFGGDRGPAFDVDRTFSPLPEPTTTAGAAMLVVAAARRR